MSDVELLREWYAENPEDNHHPWHDLTDGEYDAAKTKAINNVLNQLATLAQERDALRECVKALIRDGDALYVKGKFADPDYWAPCNWATVVEESAKLLTPSSEAGKGGGVARLQVGESCILHGVVDNFSVYGAYVKMRDSSEHFFTNEALGITAIKGEGTVGR